MSYIDAAQGLLKNAYPDIGGLESVSLGQTLAFTIQRGEFVQVLNVSNNHWVTISNIGCKPGTVNVFDSLPNNSVSSRTKEQIAAIVFSEKKDIQLQYSKCRRRMECLTVGFLLLRSQQPCAQGKILQRLTLYNTSSDHISINAS